LEKDLWDTSNLNLSKRKWKNGIGR
jgi:hypothetical protein